MLLQESGHHHNTNTTLLLWLYIHKTPLYLFLSVCTHIGALQLVRRGQRTTCRMVLSSHHVVLGTGLRVSHLTGSALPHTEPSYWPVLFIEIWFHGAQAGLKLFIYPRMILNS